MECSYNQLINLECWQLSKILQNNAQYAHTYSLWPCMLLLLCFRAMVVHVVLYQRRSVEGRSMVEGCGRKVSCAVCKHTSKVLHQTKIVNIIWEFAQRRYPEISRNIIYYPLLSLHTNISGGYAGIFFLDTEDIFVGYHRISHCFIHIYLEISLYLSIEMSFYLFFFIQTYPAIHVFFPNAYPSTSCFLS